MTTPFPGSVQRLPHDIGRFEGNVKLNLLKEKLPQIHPVDLADILEELDHHRVAIFNELETEQASETLTEVEPRVQRKLVSSLTVERVAERVDEMAPAQAADIRHSDATMTCRRAHAIDAPNRITRNLGNEHVRTRRKARGGA